MTFVDVVLYLLKKEQKTPYRKMKNLNELVAEMEQLQYQLDMMIDANYEEATWNLESYRTQVNTARRMRNIVLEEIKNQSN